MDTSAVLCERLTRRGKVTKLASLGADAKTDRPWSDLTCLAGIRAGAWATSLDERASPRYGSTKKTPHKLLKTMEIPPRTTGILDGTIFPKAKIYLSLCNST